MAGITIHPAGGGVSDHDDLTGVSANDHHNQAHTLTGADHTLSGLTIGHVLTATSATAAAFQSPAGGAEELDDLTDVDAAAPDDGDVLTWNDGDGEWQPAPAPGAGTGAATTLSFVTTASEASLSNETVLGTGVIMTDDYASRPAAATAGRIFLLDDGVAIDRDTGSAWQSWGPIFPLAGIANRPTTWSNQGSTTETVTSGAAYLDAPTGTYNVRGRVKAAPSTPYTVTACILPNIISADQFVGLMWLLNSSGASVQFGVNFAGGIQVWKNTNVTTFSANYVASLSRPVGGPVWLRIGDDGSVRTCEVSADGRHWTLVHSVSRTDFITPDRVGWAVTTQNATYRAGAALLSWLETP